MKADVVSPKGLRIAQTLVLWTTGLSGWLFTLPSVAGERLVVVVVIGDLLVLSGVIEWEWCFAAFAVLYTEIPVVMVIGNR